MAKIFSQAQMDEIYAYFKDKMNSLECIRVPELKPFADCTWDEVLAYVDGYYNGIYSLADITDVWNVGDSKNITTSNIASAYNKNAVSSKTISFAIIDFAHDDLSSPINGKTKALLTFGAKDFITEQSMNKQAADGTFEVNYDLMEVRSWLNNSYYNAIPSNIKSKIKIVSRLYNKMSVNTPIDEKVFMPTRKELFGSSYGSVGTQYSLYETASGRKIANDAYYRIAQWYGGTSYYYTDGISTVDNTNVATAIGWKPHFCL